MNTVTIAAFVNGKMMSSVTVPNQPRAVESAIRLMRDSYPDAMVCRKLEA
jgi:hypothetical protein